MVSSWQTESGLIDQALSSGVRALLAKLLVALEALNAQGQQASMDLSQEPLAPEDRNQLLELLGQGEITAQVDAMGVTTLQETGVAGIWLVTYRAQEGNVTAEILEVTRVPELLKSPVEELGESKARVAALIASQASL
uniref:HupH hydrogenase expression protein C-terminal domain-containing protein n=1 Tax=Magnetococcus massalia (strain MO-1) TaxID=451514 RepID=A0A1S7LDH4_MAGMO|nr:conserved protein of unknown function(with hydrogenase expression protein HupH C-terminal domain) [Candidatus Magnetococcus massalia]